MNNIDKKPPVFKKNKNKSFYEFSLKEYKKNSTNTEILRLTIFSLLILIFFHFSQPITSNNLMNIYQFDLFKNIGKFFFAIPFLFFMIYLLLLGLKYLHHFKINLNDYFVNISFDIGIISLVFWSIPVFLIHMLAGIGNKTPQDVMSGILTIFIGIMIFALILGYFLAAVDIFRHHLGYEIKSNEEYTTQLAYFLGWTFLIVLIVTQKLIKYFNLI